MVVRLRAPVEFQANPERFMAVRVLGYMVGRKAVTAQDLSERGLS